MNQKVIELVGLTKKYGSFTAVDNLNLSVNKGEVFGLLGPNGAGKSTTILMMLGLTEPSSGSATVCGINSTSSPIEVKRKTGYMPEDVGFYDDLTGLENLVYTALLNGLTVSEALSRAEELLKTVGLADAEGKKTGKYSRGMRQRLGLADILIKKPEVIILDEPTLGIDPKGVSEFLELIHRLSREEGHTVLLSSHHLHQVQEVCDRVGIFVGGKLIACGKIEELSKQLFANEPYTIEAQIDYAVSGDINTVQSQIKSSLGQVPGVISVSFEGSSLIAGCSNNTANEIAKAIIGSGSTIRSLTEKEYGLNDIYHRYFEGTEL